jgi:hypothetical protein
MRTKLRSLLAKVQLEPHNRFVTMNRVTGKSSQHAKRAHAVLAYCAIAQEIKWSDRRPMIFERVDGSWRQIQ